MTVSILKTEEEHEWQSFVQQHPNATIYHTLQWQEVAKVFGHKPYYLTHKDAHDRVTGVLPLFFLKGIFGRRLISVPLRDRGGPISSIDEGLVKLIKNAKELSNQLSCNYLELKSLSELPQQVISDTGLKETKRYITTVITLDNDIDNIWKSCHRVSVRQAINKSKKLGVTAKWAKSKTDVKEFYKLFLKTRKRLGVPPYPLALFEAIWNTMVQADMAKLLLVEYNNKNIGGLIIFNYKEYVIAAYMASDEKYLHLNPNNLLFWETIAWACRRGYKYYDFGASSPYQKSLIAFKSRWGGSEHKLPFYFYLNHAKKLPILDSNSSAYKFYRKAWSKLPTNITKLLGPFFTRQMD